MHLVVAECGSKAPGSKYLPRKQHPINGVSPSCDLAESMERGGMQMHATAPNDVRDHLSSRGCEVDVLGVGWLATGLWVGMGEGGVAFLRKRGAKAAR